MADRLTQLQDALDDLATQFYASIRYLSTHHAPPHPIPVDQNPHVPPPPPPPPPDDPRTFAAAQRELARDLVLKEQQIEYLIGVLPGIGTSEKEQTERLRVLERELRDAERERRQAVEERERVVARLDEVIREVRRV
ncbi:MAG: RNA polymerase II mediator complex subunit [Caeruleum heppii]|nr:MAG: RNA polymerase II mediator complex subunit [Caeruleum heppii]